MISILSVALASGALLSADMTDFSDVCHDYLPSESGKVEKTDGMLQMDTSEKILSFTSGHRALIHIRYEQIPKVVYEQGNDHLLTSARRSSVPSAGTQSNGDPTTVEYSNAGQRDTDRLLTGGRI